MAATLRIGHLQVGLLEHGVCRYGRLLASEGRRRPELVIEERNLRLTGEGVEDRRHLAALAAELGRMHVVHLQVSVAGEGTWGTGARALRNLAFFRRHCEAPLVVTLHDVNNLRALGCTSTGDWLARAVVEIAKLPVRPFTRLVAQARRGRLGLREAFRALSDFDRLAPYLVARWACRYANELLALSEEERKTLEGVRPGRNVTVIPHFIEDAAPGAVTGRSDASSRKRVVLAGFIFSSKGHQLMVEAMAFLPEVEVVFLGGGRLGSSGSSAVERLIDVARRKGVAQRLCVTGYLPEEEYRRQLATADLAVCPFERDKSASGSLSSLIAAGVPVLASDMPLIAEYNAIVPGAIPTFSPYTPEALAGAIRKMLDRSRGELTQAFPELRRRLGISAVYDLHLGVYRRLARTGKARGDVKSEAGALGR